MEVNYIAVVAAAVSAFVLGGLWYSPLLFARSWIRHSGQSEETLKSGSPAMIFGGAFLLSLIAAFVFAMFLGPGPAFSSRPAPAWPPASGGSRPAWASSICSNGARSACG